MAIQVPGRGPIGRPTDLTPERKERIVALIREGHYISTACAANGIARSTFHQWLERAERGEEPYKDFAEALKEAEAAGELAVWGAVLAGTKLPSTAGVIAASIAAERRWPERYGRRDRLEVERHDVREIQVTVGFKPPPLVVDGPGTPLEVVEGEVRELGPGDSQGEDYGKNQIGETDT